MNFRMTEVLERDDQITELLIRVFNLKDRTVRVISFLELNFALLPILLAAAICYLLQYCFFADENSAKVMVHPVLLILMCLSNILWFITYLGVLWGIYYFSPKRNQMRQILRTLREVTFGIHGDELPDDMAGGDAFEIPEGIMLVLALPD
ncbi:unnamed protein product [Larinioides sclopetarius]|uniref:Uncharacterized protein n=1 Tax=Larinioides sclopetarius TaxID=280406 RepID=A0AAV1Z599_9ARAC